MTGQFTNVRFNKLVQNGMEPFQQSMLVTVFQTNDIEYNKYRAKWKGMSMSECLSSSSYNLDFLSIILMA